jgi:hypothetical protein
MPKTLSEKIAELFDREKNLESVLEAVKTAKAKAAEKLEVAAREHTDRAKELNTKLETL